MRPFRRTLALTLALLSSVWLLLSPPALADTGKSQRELFLEAEQALDKDQRDLYRRLYRQLADYPLRPYLEYQDLRGQLRNASAKEVDRFLLKHTDTPLAGRLRAAWLDTLAHKGWWKTYLRYAVPTGYTRRRCDQLNALLQTGQAKKVWPQVPDLWLNGRSQPKTCDPVFDAWIAAGHLDDGLVWQRVALAMDAGQSRLGNYLKRFLPKKDQAWVDNWLRLRRQPEFALDQRFRRKHAYRDRMLIYAVKRLAWRDQDHALELWEKLQKRHKFAPGERAQVDKRLALALLHRKQPEAFQYLQALGTAEDDSSLHEVRIRAALLTHAWPELLDALDALPAEEQLDLRWRYWRARALAETGDFEAAYVLYQALAEERSYYGFLAADRIGQSYRFNHRALSVDEASMKKLAGEPAMRRAQELLALERMTDARREWLFALAGADDDRQRLAAALAHRWGWHNRAIFGLAQSGDWDDLEMRFPLQHRKEVAEAATRQSLDPAWVFAVIRQESAFAPDARSGAGAMGLMQLMPATARLVARKELGRPAPRRGQLYEPSLNINLGTAYLRRVLRELHDHPALAVAAYNAGPHRVRRWLPEGKDMEADIWVELVPYHETRKYLQRVFAYTVIYEHRLGVADAKRISERLRPVPASGASTAQQTGSAAPSS